MTKNRHYRLDVMIHSLFPLTARTYWRWKCEENQPFSIQTLAALFPRQQWWLLTDLKSCHSVWPPSEKTPCHIFLKIISDLYIDTLCNTKDSQLESRNILLVCIKIMPITAVSEARQVSWRFGHSKKMHLPIQKNPMPYDLWTSTQLFDIPCLLRPSFPQDNNYFSILIKHDHGI